VTVARRVVEGRAAFEAMVADMRLAHLSRLEARDPEAHVTSIYHLEVLSLLRQVDASSTLLAAWAIQGAAAEPREAARPES
jgi:Na+/phosphate symporter